MVAETERVPDAPTLRHLMPLNNSPKSSMGWVGVFSMIHLPHEDAGGLTGIESD
ncbi:MAG TPA: hypothetical protein VGU24_14600 [Microvirga sp.]|jgi:hypothetical protein|nr:hypothetical protein [Microvirga sp.]